MNSINIYGNARLDGTVNISGCKNSALPILAATILNKNISIIHNCPNLSDVYTAFEILKNLGCSVEYIDECAYVDTKNITSFNIPSHLMSKLRASVVFAGPIIARCKTACFTVPGGCKIGTRPIDIHLAAFEKMGVEVECVDGNVTCVANELKGNDIFLPLPSVGATENIMMLATCAKGVTKIYNAAKEPEICDLANFLISMGAKVFGAGTSVITVYGETDFTGATFEVMPDRIEAITFACACAASGGCIKINKINFEHIKRVINILVKMGVKVCEDSQSLLVCSNGKLECPYIINTRPYPGFPTDAQSLMMSLMSLSNGIGIIYENIFEDRLRHAYELNKMGADITVNQTSAYIIGKKLSGGTLSACDLRSGAALVVAALSADGLTTVDNCDYIDRGYSDFVNKLKNLGAKTERVKTDAI